MAKTFSAARYLVATLVVFMAASLAAIALPHDPYIRYQSLAGTIFERSRYHYERLTFDPTPVDVVVLGASRAAGGVSPPALEAALKSEGLDLHVVNLGIPAAAMDINVVEAREALRRHPHISMMLVVVPDGFPRDGHAPFAELATVEDMARGHLVVNSELVRAATRLPMRQMHLFAATQFPEGFGFKREFDRWAYPGSAVEQDTLPGWKPPVPAEGYYGPAHAKVLAGLSARRHKELAGARSPAGLKNLLNGVSRHSVDDLIALGQKTGTQVVFVYIPYFGGPPQPQDGAWLRTRGPLWTIPEIRNNPVLYADSGHTSPIASPVVARWLAANIKRQIGSGSADAHKEKF